MDEKTALSYAENAQKLSEDWRSQPAPQDMYSLLKKFFVPAGCTADIGCGDGRDADWLADNGFRARGYDSSPALLSIARERYPHVEFREARLPALAGVDTLFDNVLCETVIMHLPKEQIVPAVRSLQRITRADGILYLSWRVTECADARSADGRLYSAFEPGLVLAQFRRDRILHFEDVVSQSSGKRICRLIYRRE